MGVARTISMFITMLLRSVFLYGFTELRRGCTALGIAHVAMLLIFGLRSPVLIALYTLPIAIIYTAAGIWILLLYSLAISSIPGVWMALSQLALDLARGFADPLRYLVIYVRASMVSINILYLLHSLNPTEISALMNRIRRLSGVYPYLFMRVSSFLLKEGSEAIYTHSLKKEKPWKTLAILFIRGDELAKGFSEGLAMKHTKFRPKPRYSIKAVLAQVVLMVYDIMIAIAFQISVRP